MHKITTLVTVAALALGSVASANSAQAQSYRQNPAATFAGVAIGTLLYEALGGRPVQSRGYRQEAYPQQAYGYGQPNYGVRLVRVCSNQAIWDGRAYVRPCHVVQMPEPHVYGY